MYFKEKKDTDLDKKFKSNKKFSINPKCILIALGGIILFVAIFFLIKLLTNSNKYFIELLGDENITLYQGNEYVEPGYRGYDQKDNDLTDNVIIENNLDVNIIGEYLITYSLKDIKVTRNIKIIEKPITATYIHLLGKTTIYLDVNEEYVEPKYIVFNSSGTNLNNKVKITNNINNKVAGTYQVIYSVINEVGVTVTATRIVVVMDSEVTYKLSPSGYTNSSVTINLEILDPYYKYMILPDGNQVTSKTYEYQVSQNGTYKIETYNTKGTKKETNIKIDTIDTQKPSGSCSGYYKDGVSYINVSASDNTGISKYVLNNQTFTSNNIKYIDELKTASITIYDNANNQTTVSCKLDNKNIVSQPSSSSTQSPSLNVKESIKTYSGSGYLVKYALYIPKNATENMPLIVILPSNYSDSALNNYINLINEWKYNPIKAYIYIPQISNYYDEGLKSAADKMIELISTYKINKNKISATGFSSSGTYVYNFAGNNQQYVSKMLVMSSGISYSYSIIQNNLNYFKNLPTKGFGENGGKYDSNGTKCAGYTDWSPKNSMSSLFNSLDKSNDFVALGQMCHSSVVKYVFSLDENSDNTSDIIYWLTQ